MKKVLVFSILLVLGLVGSQTLPYVVGPGWTSAAPVIEFLAMVALAFVMIHVGYEFEVHNSSLRSKAKDYFVSLSVALGPWILCAAYILLFLAPLGWQADRDIWIESVLVSKFTAPTSAGILFSLMAAAGLSVTWMFGKARVLTIYDDLNTVLLMIPLKLLVVGFGGKTAALGAGVVLLFLAAWKWMRRLPIPVSWPWVVSYAALIAGANEAIYLGTKHLGMDTPVHLKVLLPAFALGCMLRRPEGADPHSDDAREGHQEGPEAPDEQRVSTIISAAFMVLVGLSMPPIAGDAAHAVAESAKLKLAALPMMGWQAMVGHVAALTVLSNLGKMLPAFVYRDEAHWRERLALAIGMWPRGEVGAGILIVSLGYGMGGTILAVCVLVLALNLTLTGPFIWIVKKLVAGVPRTA
ncbi:MAG: sodium:proton antiporter [Deltaproteobacteria bacterium]|nr:sodium:proton antiporter [Deltaproteobacteria bacterium]